MDHPDEWHVVLGLRADDLDAVRHAKTRPLQPRFGVLSHLGGDEDGTGLLVLWFRCDSRDAALTKAVEAYVKMRASAGLGWLDPLILSVRSPGESLLVDEALLLEAAELMAADRSEVVVLRAQTAAEVAVERAFVRLIGPKLTTAQRSKAGRLISRTLRDDRSRNILEAITGMRPDQETWWTEYANHLQRRNEVVHAGRTVTQHEAESSVRAVLRLIHFFAE